MLKPRFTKIEGRSTGYWLFLAAAGAVAALAPLSALYMFLNGHKVTSMTNQIPWGLPIVMAVYLIGASAGSLVMSATSSVFGKVEYKPFSRMAALMAFLLIVAALMAIIMDWGRPDRLMVPFFHIQPRSMFSLNAFLYSSYMALGLVYLYAMFHDMKKLERLLGLAAVGLAVLVHSGTGAIFGFVYVRELYNSPLLPPSFIAAALSSGTALMIVAVYWTFKATGRHLDERLLHQLASLMGVFILVVLYFIFIENVTRSYAPKNYEAAGFLLLHGGQVTSLFWLGLVGMGLVIPAALVFLPVTHKSMLAIQAAAWMQLVGVVIERYIIVMPAQMMPLEFFHDKEITSVFNDGVFATYTPSLPELGYSIGLCGVVVFGFALAIKLWPMLPVEARHLDPIEEAKESVEEEGEEAASRVIRVPGA